MAEQVETNTTEQVPVPTTPVQLVQELDKSRLLTHERVLVLLQFTVNKTSMSLFIKQTFTP